MNYKNFIIIQAGVWGMKTNYFIISDKMFVPERGRDKVNSMWFFKGKGFNNFRLELIW